MTGQSPPASGAELGVGSLGLFPRWPPRAARVTQQVGGWEASSGTLGSTGHSCVASVPPGLPEVAEGRGERWDGMLSPREAQGPGGEAGRRGSVGTPAPPGAAEAEVEAGTCGWGQERREGRGRRRRSSCTGGSRVPGPRGEARAAADSASQTPVTPASAGGRTLRWAGGAPRTGRGHRAELGALRSESS